MVQFLELGRKATCRKLRLFGVACCRRPWRFLDDEKIRRIVEDAESYADGRATAARLRAAYRRSCNLCKRVEIRPGDRPSGVLTNAAVAANWVSAGDTTFRTSDRVNRLLGYSARASAYIATAAADAAFFATYEGADAVGLVRRRMVDGLPTPADAIWAAEESTQADLLRDIYGPLPFRPVAADPAWLAWKDGTIPKLAQAIYDERAFDRLPVLADALEEAGCDNPDFLAHLRGPGPHTKGCWPLDLILGKG
jgi:hypothetical protein